MYTHDKKVLSQGPPLAQTGRALVMIHGRGATAQSILSLQQHLQVEGFTLFAPQATNNSWYPYSFMAPRDQNQPALDSALAVVAETVRDIQQQGIASQDIYLLGFSQGACLTSEFATRHAERFGGLIIFTGGLIGEEIDKAAYAGDFAGTPVLITTGDPDPHVPVSRVEETVAIMSDQKARVTKKVYPGRPHTILQEEIDLANQLLALPRV
jgi:phospholipase/carboxylesterase